MLKKLCVLIAFALMVTASASKGVNNTSAIQDGMETFKDNGCVNCHSKSQSQLRLSTRYYEWHLSTHKISGVSCDKCHGGDPATNDLKKAHAGMLPAKNEKSRMHPTNLAVTCGTCHQGVVNSFVESKHYQQLKSSGLGPSCITCHAHMASEVIYSGEQTATLCATCHNSTNALLPKRPEIPGKADEVVQAIRRANAIYVWADRLLEEAHHRKMDVTAEDQEMKIVRAMLSEAKVGWHAFNLDSVRKKADGAFEEGTKLKDALRQKLYPNQ